ncbi:MAG: glycosyltransferase family 39 protein, partial [Acidimicrobiia bacterium]
YIPIARDGYPNRVAPGEGSLVAFFPGYPATIRAVARTSGLSYEVSALLVAAAFGLVATVLLWVLARRLAGPDAADRTTALFCFFPGSYILSLAYAEGLMLTFAIACLLALMSRRWLLAGVAAALATGTRPNAVVLVACCAWEAGRHVRRRAEPGAPPTWNWRPVVAPLLAPVGALVYLGFLWHKTGEAGVWFRTEREGWNQRLDGGISTLRVIWRVIQHPVADINDLVATLSVIFVVVAAYVLFRSRLPSVLVLYAALIALAAFISESTVSRPRFLLTAFPLFIALALKLQGARFAVVLGCSGVLLAALSILSVGTLAPTP